MRKSIYSCNKTCSVQIKVFDWSNCGSSYLVEQVTRMNGRDCTMTEPIEYYRFSPRHREDVGFLISDFEDTG